MLIVSIIRKIRTHLNDISSCKWDLCEKPMPIDLCWWGHTSEYPCPFIYNNMDLIQQTRIHFIFYFFFFNAVEEIAAKKFTKRDDSSVILAFFSILISWRAIPTSSSSCSNASVSVSTSSSSSSLLISLASLLHKGIKEYVEHI